MSTEAAEHLEVFVKGSVIGLLLGDAIGYPHRYEDHIPEEIPVEGIYTSFGAMCLCTMANINDVGQIEPQDLMEKFYDLYLGSYLAADEDAIIIGETTGQALKNWSNGMPPDKCGILENNDNECLSRMLPIGLFYANESVDKLIDTSHEICRMTHAHVVSQVCCALYVLIIKNIFLQKSEKVFDLLEDYYKTKNYTDHAAALAFIKNNRSNNGYGEVVDSFWSAWTSHSENEDCRLTIHSAVMLGNDTNSTAALAGSFTALANGMNDIPVTWLKELKLSGEVMDIVLTFTNSVVAKFT